MAVLILSMHDNNKLLKQEFCLKLSRKQFHMTLRLMFSSVCSYLVFKYKLHKKITKMRENTFLHFFTQNSYFKNFIDSQIP